MRLLAYAWLLPAMVLGTAAMAAPAACPPKPMRVVRSAGGTIDYLGTASGLAELCREQRADGPGDYYFGVWRSDWPGAGDAYPALRTVILGPPGTSARFVTRSVPGLQWNDSFVNAGVESLTIDGHTYRTLKVAHEREGIEGNTYHSIITQWRDVATGMALKVVEDQIAGQSYGPATTWTATPAGPLR